MPDPFETLAPGLLGPSDDIRAVIPNDGADLPGGVCRAFFVGVGGDVKMRDKHGHEVILVSGNSQYHFLRPARVLATGTTATNILALY
ncbi:MAG: hypothetical protein ACJA1L_002954 [Paracoccaceae bacterium]|jgi:hypothetical protein